MKNRKETDMLKKIISGGQTGADQGGLFAGKEAGLETGGYAPKGFKTEDGCSSWLADEFGLVESWSPDYHVRTYQNAWASDGTIRIAKNFETRGEICTLKAIDLHKKPYIDIQFYDPNGAIESETVQEVVDWIKRNRIEVLNVAGNRESTCVGIQAFVEKFLMGVIERLKNENQE
jgi:hypothetical protein